ncbi:hypothetical protein KKF34_03920 [Myxococcota bacterium]|nr:hypothetical protein [Myxococcota bacterium]MBU1382707.1 hypothetical protein [Myxococcota bacterium]MBU1496003.1 hypothetical protein [Myxococcota bacterium]
MILTFIFIALFSTTKAEPTSDASGRAAYIDALNLMISGKTDLAKTRFKVVSYKHKDTVWSDKARFLNAVLNYFSRDFHAVSGILRELSQRPEFSPEFPLKKFVVSWLNRLERGFNTGNAIIMRRWYEVITSSEKERIKKIDEFTAKFPDFSWNADLYIYLAKEKIEKRKTREAIRFLLKAALYNEGDVSTKALNTSLQLCLRTSDWESFSSIYAFSDRIITDENTHKNLQKTLKAINRTRIVYSIVSLLMIIIGIYSIFPLRCSKNYWFLIPMLLASVFKLISHEFVFLSEMIFYISLFMTLAWDRLSETKFKILFYIFLILLFIKALTIAGLLPLPLLFY